MRSHGWGSEEVREEVSEVRCYYRELISYRGYRIVIRYHRKTSHPFRDKRTEEHEKLKFIRLHASLASSFSSCCC